MPKPSLAGLKNLKKIKLKMNFNLKKPKEELAPPPVSKAAPRGLKVIENIPYTNPSRTSSSFRPQDRRTQIRSRRTPARSPRKRCLPSHPGNTPRRNRITQRRNRRPTQIFRTRSQKNSRQIPNQPRLAPRSLLVQNPIPRRTRPSWLWQNRPTHARPKHRRH